MTSIAFVGGSETAVAENRSVEETREIVNKLIASENECIEHFDYSYGCSTAGTKSEDKICAQDFYYGMRFCKTAPLSLDLKNICMPLGKIFVWIHQANSILSSQKLDFYFVRVNNPQYTYQYGENNTKHDAPAFIIQKSKLSAPQVLFMERKRLETTRLEHIFIALKQNEDKLIEFINHSISTDCINTTSGHSLTHSHSHTESVIYDHTCSNTLSNHENN